MRKLTLVLSLCAFALTACGGDDTTPNTKTDTGKKKLDKGVVTTEDTGTAVTDLPPVVKKEAGTTQTCSPAFLAKSNTGAICGQTCTAATATTACKTGTKCINASSAACTATDTQCICDCASADEFCASTSGSTSGMCVGKCCQDPNNTTTNDPCPVADANAQLSICASPVKDANFMACVWICEYTQSGQTVTKKCPNDTDYNCVGGMFTDATIKACMPK